MDIQEKEMESKSTFARSLEELVNELGFLDNQLSELLHDTLWVPAAKGRKQASPSHLVNQTSHTVYETNPESLRGNT